MEAPEKIYLLSTPNRMLDGWYRDKSPIPPSFEQVEYTRTDAFIKKACEFFRTQNRCVFACIGGDVYRSLIREGVIKEFKNYMKGE